jgi:tRNA threonylcarbamoyladenosine biosynthesis protein TsaE
MPDEFQDILGGRSLSLNDLKAAADELIQKCGNVNTWLFSGEMGAGKTTLIKTICSQLGVKEGMSSPTFSIVNEYALPARGKVYHFDCYRLKHEREAFDLGAEEYFDSGNYCFVEWPEKIPSLIPAEHVTIKITPTDSTHRIIQYARHD